MLWCIKLLAYIAFSRIVDSTLGFGRQLPAGANLRPHHLEADDGGGVPAHYWHDRANVKRALHHIQSRIVIKISVVCVSVVRYITYITLTVDDGGFAAARSFHASTDITQSFSACHPYARNGRRGGRYWDVCLDSCVTFLWSISGNLSANAPLQF